MPPNQNHAKRIKVECTSPEPYHFQGRSLSDAKPFVEPAKTPAAPKKKPAGPFIIDDSDEESDTESGPAPTSAPVALPAIVNTSRPATPPRPSAPRNTMPASKLEQRAESKRLREEALARRFGSPAVCDQRQNTVKIERIEQPVTTMLEYEPIDLTVDDSPSPIKPTRQSTRPPQETTKPATFPAKSQPVLQHESRSQRHNQETQGGKANTGGTGQINAAQLPSTKSDVTKTALQPAKASPTLKPQDVAPVPAGPKKDPTFDDLRERLREAEVKRKEELKKQEATRAVAIARDEVEDRRRAEEEQLRKKRLVEDARKKAAARQEAADQARREAEKRRVLEQDVEQRAAQLEKERKKQLEEQNRIFTEKRKAERDAQERLRQQQLQKQKEVEQAQQQKLREARIRRQKERNAQIAQASLEPTDTPSPGLEEQRTTLPAPVSLSQIAKDAARGTGSVISASNAIATSPSMQPRSLHSLHPGELSRLQANANASNDPPGPVGEIGQVDLKVDKMRNDNLDWAAIAHYHNSATSQGRSESSLRRRYRQVANALKEHRIPFELIKKARDGDEAARADINRRVTGGTMPRAEPQAPVLRLSHHQQAHQMPPGDRALPSDSFIPYRNVSVNPAVRRDSPTEGRQTTGGKTIDQNFFFHMLEQNHKAFIEMDEDPESEDDEPEDRFYYVYSLKRRDLPAGSDPDDVEEWPAIRCDEAFDNLEDANSAASKEILRISNHEGAPFPNVTASMDLAQVVNPDTGMLSLELHAGDGGIVQIDVERERHTRHGKQKLPPATLSRTIYHVKQRITIREIVDEALGTERETVRESLVGASHTDRDQANDIAINHYVHANYRFEGGTPNLSKRTEVCKPQIEAWKDSLLVEQLFHAGPGDAQVEVWVEKGKVAGPRNV